MKQEKRYFERRITMLFCVLLAFCSCVPTGIHDTSEKRGKILLFTYCKGYRHKSIPVAARAIQALAAKNGIPADTTSNPALFTLPYLKQYKAVVFINTTGDIFNAEQQESFQAYIQSGGGYVGIHAAADCEYKWPWYNQLVGAYFAGHPKPQNAIIDVVDKTHVSSAALPDRWERFDEWYNYKSIQQHINVLASLDETSYEGGKNGESHPIAWYHDFDGGRAFYTGGGHTDESFSEPLFMAHLLGGIQYAMGTKEARSTVR